MTYYIIYLNRYSTVC